MATELRRGVRASLLWLTVAGCAPALPVAPTAAETGSPDPIRYRATFRLRAATDAPDGAPQTHIAWVMHSETEPSVVRDLGTERGACTSSSTPSGWSPENAQATEIGSVRCWWRGEEALWRALRGPQELRLERASTSSGPWTLRDTLDVDPETRVEPLM